MGGDIVSDIFEDEIFQEWKRVELVGGEASFESQAKQDLVKESIAKLTQELLSQQGSGRLHPLDEVESLLRKTVILKSEFHYYALTLWIAQCFATSEFDFAPRLGIWSPEKRCGKSLLLEIIQNLTPNSRMTSSISAPVLFRMLAKDETLVFLIDESDTIFGRNGDKEKAEALRQVVNSGYKRGASVWRCDGKNFEPKEFPTYGVLAMAGIGTSSIPETVADRSIVIEMRRKRANEQILEFESDQVDEIFEPIRTYLGRWMKVNAHKLRALRPELPSELNSRARDVWKPLFKVAEISGEIWKERAHLSAIALSKGDTDPEEASLSLRILTDIREVFVGEKMSTKDLINALRSLEESPWSYLERFNPSTVAFLLKNYGIKPHNFGSVRGYFRNSFVDAWDRYLEAVKDVRPVSDGEVITQSWTDSPFDA